MPSFRWNPASEIAQQEKFILNRCSKKRRLFSFLRENCGVIFDEAFQQELESMYRNTGAGKDATPPALMAMALIMQGYLGLSADIGWPPGFLPRAPTDPDVRN
jgi:hypothetical protein